MQETEVIDLLHQHADTQTGIEMSAYMKNRFPFLGIHKPERAKLTRDFLRAMKPVVRDWALVHRIWELPQREFQYLAIDVVRVWKDQLDCQDLAEIQQLAVTKSWWDTVDALDAVVGAIALNHPQAVETVLAWSTADSIWLRRLAIDHQLQRKEHTDTALLDRIIINNLGSHEFFINKAIGWALRDYSKTNRDWVRRFIEDHRAELSPLSIREASRYIQAPFPLKRQDVHGLNVHAFDR
jgi:3-methyladenine DNA glycosylase AlkD